jgi:aspartate racemase
MKTIGMLGGMGPESTSYTYMRMIRYCQERYGARLDSDFPPIIMYSMPVPDVVEEGSDEAEILALLGEGIGRLDRAGASFSFIACNTMQGFVPALRKRFPMLSLVEETVAAARESGLKRWGILGTEVTLRKGYYQAALKGAGFEPIAPERAGQREVTRAIREILAGDDMDSPRSRLLSVVRMLERQGAEGVILACTDLPIPLSGCDAGLPLLDTADISARAAVERWRRQ